MLLLLLYFSLLYQVTVRFSLSHRESAVLPYVSAAAEEFHVPIAMIMAVIRAESNFYANAVSSAGAQGLMQLMPQTFSWLYAEKLQDEMPMSSIMDPNTNIRYGTYYLSYLYGRFGTWRTALAAYNAGEGRVEEWLRDPTLCVGNTLRRIPFPETAAYVEKTLNYYVEYLNRYSDKGDLS